MDNDNEFLETKGKGGIKDVPDPRDYHFSQIAGSLPPFDWVKGYDIEEVIGRKLTVKDQNGSGSCGGQAWSTLGQAIDPDNEDKSAKFIYAQTFIPPAGTNGRDNCMLVINKGWGDEDKTPSYDGGMPPGEMFMERVGDITPEALKHAKIDSGLSFATVPINIDTIAQAIANNKGCVIGITGKNNGTWTSQFPIHPDVVDINAWNHWVYVGKAKMINGKKYIGFLNSWGDSVGDKGWQWIDASYVISPYVWSAWTMVYNFPKPPQYIFTLTMRQGSRGPEVAELQTRLGIKADGIFGAMTKIAVRIYQLAHLLVGDGVVGPKTLAQLNK